MRFTLCLPDGSRTPTTLALPGRHNVQNALAAATIGWQLGVAPDVIARALEDNLITPNELADIGRACAALQAKVMSVAQGAAARAAAGAPNPGGRL